MVSLFRSKSRIRLIPGLALTLAAQWFSAFKVDKMVTTGRLSIHFRKPLNGPKNGERVREY
jgi:hypothetical protein